MSKQINNQEELLAFMENHFADLEMITSNDILSLAKEIENLSFIGFNTTFLFNECEQIIKTSPKKTDFFAYISENNILHKAFEHKKDISTRGEKIESILKELKREAKKAEDTESIADIEWILQQLYEGDIYEITENIMENEHLNSEINKEGVDYMIQYSKIENDLQKSKDFSIVRMSNINKGFISNKIEQKNTMIKKLSPEISSKLTSLLSRIDYPDFDIFAIDSLTNAKGTLIVALEIVDRLDIVKSEIIEHNILKQFLSAVIENYSRINAYYHNDLHGADVTQTIYTMLIRGNLKAKMKLDDLSKFAIIIGSFGHDLKHPGQSNMFHINTRSKIAIRYNDKSVLENYHTANIFKLMKDDNYNIFKNFKPEEYRIMRRRIIEGVLATDMANHQKVLGAIKNRAEVYSIKMGKNFTKMFNETDVNKLFDAQQEVLNMLIHTSDISNPAKPGKISQQWTDRVYEEFFRQGDLEKSLGIPVSVLCDRLTTNVNKAMIGFINFVVMPTIDILYNILPEIPEYSKNIRENLSKHQLEFSKDEQAKKLKEEKINK